MRQFYMPLRGEIMFLALLVTKDRQMRIQASYSFCSYHTLRLGPLHAFEDKLRGRRNPFALETQRPGQSGAKGEM